MNRHTGFNEGINWIRSIEAEFDYDPELERPESPGQNNTPRAYPHGVRNRFQSICPRNRVIELLVFQIDIGRAR